MTKTELRKINHIIDELNTALDDIVLVERNLTILASVLGTGKSEMRVRIKNAYSRIDKVFNLLEDMTNEASDG